MGTQRTQSRAEEPSASQARPLRDIRFSEITEAKVKPEASAQEACADPPQSQARGTECDLRLRTQMDRNAADSPPDRDSDVATVKRSQVVRPGRGRICPRGRRPQNRDGQTWLRGHPARIVPWRWDTVTPLQGQGRVPRAPLPTTGHCLHLPGCGPDAEASQPSAPRPCRSPSSSSPRRAEAPPGSVTWTVDA